LFELFWSGHRADSSIKVIISRLRRVLGSPGIIEFRSGGYRFNWEDPDVALDREQYEDHWKRGERLEKKGDLPGAWSCYEHAASFYRGRYLEDIEGSWAEGSRQNLDEAQRVLLTKLADISKKLGRLETMYFYQDRLGQIGKKG
jgi:two-component SAPR family response regulator